MSLFASHTTVRYESMAASRCGAHVRDDLVFVTLQGGACSTIRNPLLAADGCISMDAESVSRLLSATPTGGLTPNT